MTHRIALVTQFRGDLKHLKRNIKEVLKRRGVGHVLQTTQVNGGEKQTELLMEGESAALHTVQTELVSHLQSIFPRIVIQDWQEMASDSPLFGLHIAPTPGSLSTGFVEELVDQSQRPEGPNWMESFSSSFIQAVNAIKDGRQVAYEIQSSIDSIKKFVHITHRKTTVYLNIGGCATWTQLKQVIQKCEDLKIKKPINKIYSLLDGHKSYVQDWYGFMAEGHYYVETDDVVFQELTKDIEEFIDKLKTLRKRPETDIQKVKEIFTEQGILFDDLMATGELALTDAKLEKYGIAQLGLRISILAVIKSNTQ